MEAIEIILGLLTAMIILVALARRLHISYPILLVLSGLAIGFIPGIPPINLNPDLVFVLFLPPILQLSAYYTSVRDFRANLRSIGLLAIGLVLTTMTVVAVVAHFVIGMPWAAAFVLGAIVAPPDAVAATSMAQRLHLPRRIVAVLEGESLVNDATALVAYRVAIAAVVTGAFSWIDAGSQFLLAASGGITIGIVVAFVLTPLFRLLTEDVAVYLVLTFLSGFGAYLLAEAFHASGVLAVVTLGICYTRPRFNTMTPELRLQGTAIWDIVIFVLNGLIFIIIGVQLRTIVEQLPGLSPLELLLYASVICLTVILVRIAWVFPGAYLPRVPLSVRKRDPFPRWQNTMIVAWTGMRGIVSLAAALALPLTIENGAPFPTRSLIIFLTFSVILATLVLQGLSLPFLIRRLNVVEDEADSSEQEENKARLKTAEAAYAYLQEIGSAQQIDPQLLEKLRHQYGARIRRYSARHNGESDSIEEQHFTTYAHIEKQLIEKELATLVELRNQEVINDEVMRRVQYDLDVQWVSLQESLQKE